jgi:hypothetical protein
MILGPKDFFELACSLLRKVNAKVLWRENKSSGMNESVRVHSATTAYQPVYKAYFQFQGTSGCHADNRVEQAFFHAE